MRRHRDQGGQASLPSQRVSPAEWTGIRGMDLPLRLADEATVHTVQASLDLRVSLNAVAATDVQVRRLHALAARLAECPAVALADLSQLLRDAVSSHLRGGATAARATMRFKLLVYDPALIAPDCGGWKPYPVVLESLWDAGSFHVDVQITATYASTHRLHAGSHILGGPAPRESLVEVHVRLAGDDGVALGQLAQRIEAAMAGVHAALARHGRAARARCSEEDAAQYVRETLSNHYAGTRVTIRSLGGLDTLHGTPYRPPNR